MKGWKFRPSITLSLVTLLVPLLALLAVLQFHWLGEVSRAEQERMRAGLQVGASRFSQDFDAELTRAYLTFQVNTDTAGGRLPPNFSPAYQKWLATAPFPGLIAGLFWVHADEGGDLVLMRFDPDSGSTALSDWPPGLAELRERFQRELRNSHPEQGTILLDSSNPVVEEIPALIIPPSSPLNADSPADRNRFISLGGYTIAVLDLDYIKQQVIPTLARRYFSRGDEIDYNQVIVSRADPKKTIYKSAANIPDEGSTSFDATVNLLGLRPDEARGVVYGDQSPRALTAQAHSSPSDSGRVSISITRPNENSPLRIITTEDSDRWSLMLRHRTGSLEAAVDSIRRRNLAISLGILLLLGTNIVLIIILTHRAGKLARQQMDFVAGVSHELRTPLAVICSAGENLADGVINDLTQVRRYGRVIKEEGRRLNQMVEQVLQFAGLRSGRKLYDFKSLRVESLIEDALAACMPLIKEQGFNVETHIQPNLPPVGGDGDALGRSIQNLLNNALKYSGAGRWIGIKARSETQSSGVEVDITVEDKGPGISSDDQPHIFEPFYRGHAVIASQIHGSGLGLSLVKEVVQAHGGRVTFSSAVGRGSSFTLHLPALGNGELAAAPRCTEKGSAEGAA